MNAPLARPPVPSPELVAHIDTACARIAPTWPLDQFIAVNPWWGWVSQPITTVAAHLGTLAATPMTPPRAWFREQWTAGHLTRSHLDAAIRAERADIDVDTLVKHLELPPAQPHRLPLITDLRDGRTPPRPGQTWTEVVTHQVSQHCATWFDRTQAAWTLDPTAGLFATWRTQLAADRGLPWSKGRWWIGTRMQQLADDPRVAIGEALDALGIPDRGRTAYLTAVLLSINGWAAWCAYARWQARLGGSDDAVIVDLLAIRVVWEWLLLDDTGTATLPERWGARWGQVDDRVAQTHAAQRVDWLLQRAMEFAYQQPVVAALSRLPTPASVAPAVQAVFCIDVRSEVFRRALEATSPAVHTRGFAGFFGLPIAYAPAGSAMVRPQLPGLLSPALTITDDAPAEGRPLAGALAARRQQTLGWKARWAAFRAAPASAFSFVESMGLLYSAKLLGDSVASTATAPRWEDTGLPASVAHGLRPRMPQAAADPAGVAGTAKAILTAMGLVRDFAPLVLIAGHGSQTANNPHAAGLDCGACGGQTGEVNARALADLLNTPAVRDALRPLGIDIPRGTHFLPGLHNTTTDDVVLYDTDAVPAALDAAVEQLRRWLAAAGDKARAERAPTLGLAHLVSDAATLGRSIRERANDWAQVRPEWGLADCAAFVVAPRARTRDAVLGGRSFLHDYDWRDDPDLSVLTLIMTAPMVVTNWINAQYHASTVDNRRFGSGNKVLHNVVAGRIGVFEGNGGDLRIGLPWQSVHDGRRWRHTPLRLSVFIEAPQASIERVMAQHAVVRDLVDNGWLHLFQIEPQGTAIVQWQDGGWVDRAPAR
ncbi:MAG: DUF2309 domain-containing protein [Burkholderiales bacterium]|jgi:hypothetical protein|nr:DUF2309 domain-containing protein [Burkholderiales bacterium]